MKRHFGNTEKIKDFPIIFVSSYLDLLCENSRNNFQKQEEKTICVYINHLTIEILGSPLLFTTENGCCFSDKEFGPITYVANNMLIDETSMVIDHEKIHALFSLVAPPTPRYIITDTERNILDNGGLQEKIGFIQNFIKSPSYIPTDEQKNILDTGTFEEKIWLITMLYRSLTDEQKQLLENGALPEKIDIMHNFLQKNVQPTLKRVVGEALASRVNLTREESKERFNGIDKGYFYIETEVKEIRSVLQKNKKTFGQLVQFYKKTPAEDAEEFLQIFLHQYQKIVNHIIDVVYENMPEEPFVSDENLQITIQLMMIPYFDWWREEVGLQNAGKRMDYRINFPKLAEEFLLKK